MIVDLDKKKEDELKNDDSVTMEFVRQVTELVHPMIKFTVDIPSDHDDNKVAVLDLNIKLNKDVGNRIYYEFFEKPTKNQNLLLAESAISSSTKRTILTQECMRQMRIWTKLSGRSTMKVHSMHFQKWWKRIKFEAETRLGMKETDAKPNSIKSKIGTKVAKNLGGKTYKSILLSPQHLGVAY